MNEKVDAEAGKKERNFMHLIFLTRLRAGHTLCTEVVTNRDVRCHCRARSQAGVGSLWQPMHSLQCLCPGTLAS